MARDGRGLVARAFAMRLMHLGINVHIVGGVVTPAIGKGDRVLLISGSGESTSLVNSAKIAKNAGADVSLISSYPDSSVGKIADYTIRRKGLSVETDEGGALCARPAGYTF